MAALRSAAVSALRATVARSSSGALLATARHAAAKPAALVVSFIFSPYASNGEPTAGPCSERSRCLSRRYTYLARVAVINMMRYSRSQS